MIRQAAIFSLLLGCSFGPDAGTVARDRTAAYRAELNQLSAYAQQAYRESAKVCLGEPPPEMYAFCEYLDNNWRKFGELWRLAWAGSELLGQSDAATTQAREWLERVRSMADVLEWRGHP